MNIYYLEKKIFKYLILFGFIRDNNLYKCIMYIVEIVNVIYIYFRLNISFNKLIFK